VKVRINEKGAGRLLARHPWVYKSDVLEAPDQAGLYPVFGPKGLLAYAAYNPLSEIAVRAFWFSHVDNPTQRLLDNLQQSLNRRRPRIESNPQGGYRLVHAEGDFLPALVMDYYAGHVVIQVGSAALEPLIPQMLDLLHQALPLKSVLAKNDQKTRTLEGLESYCGLLSGTVPDSVVVHEGPIRYKVNLLEGQKTGGFIDQRDNRLRLAEYRGEQALDVFSYHGSFALHLAPNFKQVIAVDSSASALAGAIENAALNGFGNLETTQANAFEFLRGADKRKERFDLIVLDPPALVKNKRDLERAYAAYKELNLRGIKLLTPGGILATASCSHHLGEPLFYQMLTEAAADAHRSLRVIEKRGQGWDHPVLLGVPETYYLKFALLEVA
jgi:23S rRNA (cytosine1962-C5)-methyltransferase